MTLGKISLNVGEKSDFTKQKRRNSTKTAVKTAKKPILREKCAPKSSGKRTGNATSFKVGDERTYKAASNGGYESVKIRRLQKESLESLANRLTREGWENGISVAMKTCDWQMLDAYLKVGKFVGFDFASSPESSQKIELGGNVKRNITINFRKATPEDAK